MVLRNTSKAASDLSPSRLNRTASATLKCVPSIALSTKAILDALS